ncbi:MAG: glycogen-binding domain-containing protein, partial [Lentisphaerota bacterium]
VTVKKAPAAKQPAVKAAQAAAVKKAPAVKQPAVKAAQAAAVKKAPAVKQPAVKAAQTAAVKKVPAAKQPGGKHKHVKFQVQTKPGSRVYVGGDFNEWNHLMQELMDEVGNGVYEVVIALEPGIYEYKFHINDNWCVDPENPNFRPNAMGTLNSVIIVE